MADSPRWPSQPHTPLSLLTVVNNAYQDFNLDFYPALLVNRINPWALQDSKGEMMNENLFEAAHKALSEVMKGSSVLGDTERNFEELLELISKILQRTDSREIPAGCNKSALKQPENKPSVSIR